MQQGFIQCLPVGVTEGFIVLAVVIAASCLFGAEPATQRTDAISRYEKLRIGAWFGTAIRPWAKIEEARKLGKDPNAVVPPVRYDADYNAAVLKKVGINYAVINAKESGGACTWDSEYTDHDITRWGKELGDRATGVLASFIKACRKHGVMPGLNYCYGKDAYHRDELRKSWDEYFTFADNQLAELLTHFGPIGEIWFTGVGEGKRKSPIDGEYTFPRERLHQAYNKVKSLQPDCLVAMHARYSWPVAYPTDIFQPGDGMPPEAGYSPWKKYKGKTYYIPQETYVVAMPDSDVTTMAILCHEINERGANAILILDSRIDETGRFLPEIVEKLAQWRRILDGLPPNRHKLALRKKGDMAEYVVARAEAPTDPVVKEKSQRQAVARFRATRLAEESLKAEIGKLKRQDGKTVEDALKDNPTLRSAIDTAVASAPILERRYVHEKDCHGPSWCARRDHKEDCHLTIGIHKSKLGKLPLSASDP